MLKSNIEEEELFVKVKYEIKHSEEEENRSSNKIIPES